MDHPKDVLVLEVQQKILELVEDYGYTEDQVMDLIAEAFRT